MTDGTRREFLKQIAKTALYAAPVIHTLAAPIEVVGQNPGSLHKPPMAAALDTQQPSTTTQPGGPAPWEREPPGSAGGTKVPERP